MRGILGLGFMRSLLLHVEWSAAAVSDEATEVVCSDFDSIRCRGVGIMPRNGHRHLHGEADWSLQWLALRQAMPSHKPILRFKDSLGPYVVQGVDNASLLFIQPTAKFLELTFSFVQAGEFVPVDDDLVGIEV